MGSYAVSKQRLHRVNRWNDLLWLRVAIGNRDGSSIVKVRLLLDTGASFTTLPTGVLQLVGCELEQPLRTQIITAASGTISAPVVAVPWFNCLGQRIENFSVVAYTIPANTFVDGLLGIDFLRKYRAIINVAEAEIWIAGDD